MGDLPGGSTSLTLTLSTPKRCAIEGKAQAVQEQCAQVCSALLFQCVTSHNKSRASKSSALVTISYGQSSCKVRIKWGSYRGPASLGRYV